MTEINSFLKGTSNPEEDTELYSVSGPRGTFYSSVACPKRHMTLRVQCPGGTAAVQGGGGLVTL